MFCSRLVVFGEQKVEKGQKQLALKREESRKSSKEEERALSLFHSWFIEGGMQVDVAEEMSELWSILACPYCLQPLRRTSFGAECTSCHQHYPCIANGQIDLRLKRAKALHVPFTLAPSFKPNKGVFHILPMNPNPQVEFGKPQSITGELASYITKAQINNSLMLDLGCGDTRCKTDFEHAGFKYVGLDYDSPRATLLGDAHALPFLGESFGFIFSHALLEHLQYPFIAVDEAYRVLKPNSKFIGTVAFLEPFHGNSFYHHTHLGLFNLLKHAGFNVIHISPNPEWDVLTAQASMILFPKMPQTLGKILVAPLRSFHRIWWKTGRHLYPSQFSEIKRLLWTSGSLIFIAEKP